MLYSLQKFVFLAFCCAFLLANPLQAQDVPAFIELKPPTQGGLSSVTAFSHDGTKVVTIDVPYSPIKCEKVPTMESAAIRIWDVATGKELQKVCEYPIEKEETTRFNLIAFSPDSKKLAQANYKGVVQILDIDSGKVVQEMKGHEAPLESIAFSPDGKKLATASLDKTARIWDAESGKELQKLEGHTGFVLSAVFSPDGKEVLTTGSNKAHMRSMIFNHGTDKEQTVTFNADNDGTARIWDAESGKELKQLELYKGGDAMTSASISPDWKKIVVGRWAFVAGKREYQIRVYDAESGLELTKLDMDDKAKPFQGGPSLTFFPDGRKIVLAYMEDRNALIYDADSGKELQRFGNGCATSVIFSPDGKKILARGLNALHIWNVETLLRPAISNF